ncbi:MAG: MarR family transcriptional regulator [Leptolyngbya sp. DLM2.Bin15]|nr:MAG: MarR family transcriptional regulator [Leptolyngbya sp. DLM2.Bin15]
MSPLPDYSPRQLRLGPLEAEVMDIIWHHNPVTVRDIHDQILSDPDRELAYASVTTVLNRLEKKGWITRQRQGKLHYWRSRLSRADAQILQAHHQLQAFLAVSNPDIVAAFVDSLDAASLEQLDAIAQRLHTLREARESEV